MSIKVLQKDVAIDSPVVGQAVVVGASGFETAPIPTVPSLPTFVGISMIKNGTTSVMTGTSLVVNDTDCTATSRILWTSSASPAGYIQIDPNAGSFTITSSASESSLTFNYTLIK